LVPLDGAFLALGLTLLVAGGRGLVAAASRLADSLGVSQLTIGLTVVAFGTSAPELAVNSLAAVRGNVDLAFGNVVGSNIANVALVIGLSALVRPLPIESILISREIPMMLLATAAALVLGFDRIRGAPEFYDRSDGVIFLLLFSVFLYYSISGILARWRDDPIADAAARKFHPGSFWTAGRASLLAAVGLASLLLGAQLTVSHAVSLAEALDVPRVVIALTIVAIGTSLPELATSLVAAWNGQTGLAVGNVVGSNIFNLLFILGATAAIQPVPVPEAGGAWDLAALAVFSAALLPLMRAAGSRIDRKHGLALIAGYLAYMTWRLSG
jgi:cation:H+ antiporter